jgi:hypothetical protein
MKKLLTAAILSLAAIGTYAQNPNSRIIKVDTICYPHEWLLDQITNRFGESPVYTMNSDKDAVTTMFTNKQKGTYTIIMNYGGGFSCVLDGGKGVKSFATKCTI